MVVAKEGNLEGVYCAGCGCVLAPYEVFASRIRGLKKPVCLGCAIEALVFLKDDLKPMVEEALIRCMEYTEKYGDRGSRIRIKSRGDICLKFGRWCLFLAFGDIRGVRRE